jgi:AraC-like DNA-binding protein
MDARPDTPLFHSAAILRTLEGQIYQKPLHQHPETAELLLITEGQGQFTINNKPYLVRAGSIVLYNAGDWHEERASSPFSALSMCCSGPLLAGLPQSHIRTAQTAPVQQLREFPKLLALLQDLITENSSNYLNKQQTVNLNLALFLEVLDRNLRPGPLPAAPDSAQLMRMAQHFIEENSHLEMTLDVLSNEVGLSKYYLARQFKDFIGVSPIQYAIQCRMRMAKQLLETTAMPVASIARTAGYKSETHFQQAFKKAAGISPGAYRLSKKKDKAPT